MLIISGVTNYGALLRWLRFLALTMQKLPKVCL